MGFLERPAALLYDFLDRRRLLIRSGVRADLEQLYPGGNQEELRRNYYMRKLEKSLLIVLGGSLLAMLLALRAAGERRLEPGNALKRGAVLDDAGEVTLEAVLNGGKERFSIKVEPLQLSPEEAESCYQEFCESLPQLIAGKNASLQEVSQDLDLLEKYAGYPFDVEWKSENVECVTSTGTVKLALQETEVRLKAKISYGDMEWEQDVAVRLLPEELTLRERRYRELQEVLIVAEGEDRTEEYWMLPESVDGMSVKWSRAVEDNSLILWAGALLAGVLVYGMSDRDLHDKLEKQRIHMKREYSDVVHKLALYLGAGMTLRGAFGKIAAEYERKKAGGSPRSPAYEEMLYTCRELKAGVSEANAYEHFGRRTGLQEYIRLSTLMTQNLKKGSSSLLPRLHEEAERAQAEQLQMGRKLGEEASTKLLLPMVMMLGVVMVMVMLPAFSSMGL